MFYHPTLLSKKGPLGTIWIAGHSGSKKLTKRKVMETNMVIICADLAEHIKKFALPVRASLILGASLILHRKTTYLLKDVLDVKKRMRSCQLTGRPEPINLKPVLDVEKAYKKVTLAPRFDLGFDLDLAMADILADDEPLSNDHFQRNMARPEDITLPGAYSTIVVYSGKKKADEPPQDDFGPLPLEDTEAAWTTTGAGETSSDQDQSRRQTVVVPEHQEDQAAEEIVAQEPIAPQAPGPVVVVAAPVAHLLPGKRQRKRGRKGFFDEVTVISKEQMKAQLADRKIGTKPHADLDVVINDVRRKNEQKAIYGTGDAGISKVLQQASLDAYSMAVKLFKEKAARDDPEDPFGWCDDDVMPQPVQVGQASREEDELMMQDVDVARKRGRDVSSVYATNNEEATAYIPDYVPPEVEEEDALQQSVVQSKRATTDRTEDGKEMEPHEPSPKRPRRLRDLNLFDRVERLAAAGDYLETRYEKLAKKDEPVTFQQIMDGNSRLKAARCFSVLLSCIKDGKVTVQQDEPYGPIIIEKIDPNCRL